MKRYFFVIITIFLFFFMLVLPQDVFNGAQSGLMLWFQTVLPSLLPFLILVNLLLKSDSIHFISRLLYPVFGRLFNVSRNGCFCILTGFLCGYPMGAKVTDELVFTGRISRQEGAYLLSFCNNTSPGFIAGFTVTQVFGRPDLVFPSLAILLLVPVLVSVPFRFLYRMRSVPKIPQKKDEARKKRRLQANIMDAAIMDSFETVTKIGGYIILFSVLLSLASLLPFSGAYWENGFLPFMEITNGIAMLGNSRLSFSASYILAMGLCAFGGFCAAAQTQSMLVKSRLPVFPYIMEKLAAALAASFLSYLYITFC